MAEKGTMPVRTVALGLNFEEAAFDHLKESYAAENYALDLCMRAKAHLSALLSAPVFKIPLVVPGAEFISAWKAPAEEINSTRRARAETAKARLSSAAKSAGITADIRILQEGYADQRESLVLAARPSDVIIFPRPGHYLSLGRHLVEAVLFTSGRPVVLVPADWTRGARLAKVTVAWDGGGRAARAVGDAMPLMACADEVEIVCVSHAAHSTISATDLAAHLARHCQKVTCCEIAALREGVGETLRAHAEKTGADLLVMGAYAHPRVLETVLGGVTADMLASAELPLFLSH